MIANSWPVGVDVIEAGFPIASPVITAVADCQRSGRAGYQLWPTGKEDIMRAYEAEISKAEDSHF